MLHVTKNWVLSQKYFQFEYRIINVIYDTVKCYYGKYNLKEYTKCYRILGIPDDSDQECVRKAFIDLCKKYHPDSGGSSADAVKFQEIESAYRTLQNKFSEERWNVNESIGEYGLYYKEEKRTDVDESPEVFDIKHTAPQHRQYLSYEGIGSGTPSQREKQFTKYKTVVAVNNVYDHQIKKLYQGSNSVEPSLVIKNKTEARKVKTRYGMERLVEDLIQESMAKGQFDNLKGQGKPLPPSNYNPYVDFVTHKMNEILIDNGFSPEWIILQKEIAEDIQFIREKLIKERQKLGAPPLNLLEVKKWKEVVLDMKMIVQKLNQKINKYNLVVPMLQKQKLYFDLEKESNNILQSSNHHGDKKLKEEEKNEIIEMKEDLLSSLFSLFK